MKNIFLLFLLLFNFQIIFSQTILEGKVTDAETGEQILFGTVAVYQNDILLTGTETDFDGYYKITGMDAGKYDVVFSYTGYNDYKITGVIVENGKTILFSIIDNQAAVFHHTPCDDKILAPH